MLVIAGNSQAEKKVMSIVDFLNIPGISSPQFSPDGCELIYILSESNWDANKKVGHIWRIRVDGNDPRQITYGKEGESVARWSPDGRFISFITKRDEDKVKQIYIMRSDGGEGMRLTNHKTAVSSPQWSTDSKSLYFLASDTLSKDEESRNKSKDDVYKLDENYKQKHLWKVAVETKQETRITEGEYSIMDYHFSTDGNQIIVHRSENPLNDFYWKSEIWVLKKDGSTTQQLTENIIGEYGARMSPDGNLVLFTAFANKDFDFYYNDKLFLAPSNGSIAAEAQLTNWPYQIVDAEWSVDGKSIFLMANMGSQVQLWQYYLKTGEVTQLTSGNHSIRQWHYQPAVNKHIVARSTEDNPGDLFLLQEDKLTQITSHYDYLAEEFHLPSQELISWKGADGVTVEGIVSYPHNYKSGDRYPLVVQTHGGPASSDRIGFSVRYSHYYPVLTGKGYVVLQPNYRGSTGYGDDFLRNMVGSYFNQSHLDVMEGVDFLIEKGVADPDRLVKMGWSAGGHMTNKIITYTDRFKAASSGAGAVNWIGMYAQSDIRTYRTPWFGGSPWEKDAPIDLYWDHSPLKDISKVTTPTLVIVGENDVRVPLSQSVELFRALRSLNVATHLYVAPREPHGWRELRHQLYKINVELDWFAKYALGEEYEWENVSE